MVNRCLNCGSMIISSSPKIQLCDDCNSKISGMYLLNLDSMSSEERLLELYERLAKEVDKKAAYDVDREAIKREYYKLIDAQYKKVVGTGIEDTAKLRAEKERSIVEKEEQRRSYAKSFNEFYEYDVVTIINENHGMVDKEKMMKIFAEYTKKGWKLHTIYSNELGKNATSVLGFGVNSTACEDVLIFERRIPNPEE